MYKRSLSVVAALALGVSMVFSNSIGTQASENEGSSEIIVKFKPGTSLAQSSSLHAKADSQVIKTNSTLGFQVVKVPAEKSVKQAIQEYQKNPDVLYVEPNHVYRATLVPNDTDYAKQYALQKVEAEKAWDITKGSGQVKIAILDTGVDYNHLDLKGKVEKGRDFIDNDDDPMDENKHGTHCAGVAAATMNNRVGIVGMAPNVKIIAERVLDAKGNGTADGVASGITHAADLGAHVISLSLGSTDESKALQDAVDYAVSKGSTIVAAAGNDNSSTPNYPAYYENVIAVAATDQNDRKADFSNYGKWVDVAAPGVDIYSTVLGSGYESISGTSMATPLVAGVAGLLASQGKKANEIRASLEETADAIQGTGDNWTHGRVNAYKAMSR
nr:S8 family serine peptidase [Thermoactinomyces sp. DSM 45892]